MAPYGVTGAQWVKWIHRSSFLLWHVMFTCQKQHTLWLNTFLYLTHSGNADVSATQRAAHYRKSSNQEKWVYVGGRTAHGPHPPAHGRVIIGTDRLLRAWRSTACFAEHTWDRFYNMAVEIIDCFSPSRAQTIQNHNTEQVHSMSCGKTSGAPISQMD